jgi:hypothetical protein
MECYYCHKKLTTKWNFCPFCGNAIQKNKMYNVEDLVKTIEKCLSCLEQCGIGEDVISGITVQAVLPNEAQSKPKQLISPEFKKHIKSVRNNRVTPKSKVRRIGDRIIFELNVPGVKSVKDISLIKLEKSVEVHALSPDKMYVKTIPFDLEIQKFDLKKETLTIELQ